MRSVTPTDINGLARLYDGLDLNDRYRRFFAVYRPQRPFFEHMANAVDHGGFGVVAVHSEPQRGEARSSGKRTTARFPTGRRSP